MYKIFKLILILVGIHLPIMTFSQELEQLEQFKNYFDNKVSLDDIEGIYSINYYYSSVQEDTYNHTTERSNNLQKKVMAIKGNGNIFNVYIFDEETKLFRKWESMKIHKSNNLYQITMRENNYHNLLPFAILDNKFTLLLNSKSEFGQLKFNSEYKYEVEEKIYPKEKRTTTYSNGTCFLINSEGYLITNYHVIKDANNIYVTMNNSLKKKLKAELIDYNTELDIAILKVNIPSVKIPFVIKNKTSDVGTSAFTLGFPLTQAMGNETKLSVGIINSKSGFKGDTKYYQISNPIQPGNSGGPLFDNQGNLIGLVTSKYTGGDNVGYALKSSLILNYLESLDINFKLNQLNTISKLQLQSKFKTLKEFVFLLEVN